MPPSSPSRPKRLRPRTPNNAGRWRPLIMLSRTVRHLRQVKSMMRPPHVQLLMFAVAGMAAGSLRSSCTAVFSATFADDYTRIMAKDPDAAPLQAAMRTTPSIPPNRISWYFNLRGPSMHINTACSGSMIAMDQACQSIQTATLPLYVDSRSIHIVLPDLNSNSDAVCLTRHRSWAST